MKLIKLAILIIAAIFILRFVQILYAENISEAKSLETTILGKDEEIKTLREKLNETMHDYEKTLEEYKDLELICKLPEALKAAKDNAESHIYDVDYFNCEDFSKSLAKKHQNMGYPSFVVRGWYVTDKVCTDDHSCQSQFPREYEVRCFNMRCEFRHAWTETIIPFDATGGCIIPPSDLWRYKRD